MTGPDVGGLIWSAVPLAVGVALLAACRLGQVVPFLVGSARLVGQMTLLAVVFRLIVAADHPAVVLGVAALMLGVAAHTVGGRLASGRRASARFDGFWAMGLGSMLVLAVSTRLSLRVEPWYDARVILPLLGMILGNCVNTMTLAAERFDADLAADRDLVERRLSLGATPRQAATPALRAAAAAGLTPIANNMMIAGVVSIPGMTTGQILAGADVGSAVRYQIMIYLGIGGVATLGVQLLLWSRLRQAFTPADQLRRFDPPAPPPKAAAAPTTRGSGGRPAWFRWRKG